MSNKIIHDEMNIAQYIKLIRKYWKYFVAIVGLSVLITGWHSMTRPAQYQSSVTIVPLSLREIGEVDRVSEIRNKELTSEKLVMSILESRTMLQRIIDSLGLGTLWEIAPDLCLQKLMQSCDISLSNGIISIVTMEEDPNIASNIANAYVDNLDYFNQTLNLSMQKSLVSVIDRAVPAQERMARKTLIKCIMAFALSSFLSLILSLFKEYYMLVVHFKD